MAQIRHGRTVYSVSCCTPCSSTFSELAELSVPVGCNVAHCLRMRTKE